MRHKPPLILMEQMVMLLVFALASALCLQAFVKSDSMSKRSEARDRAVILCQSAAEVLRSDGGSVRQAAGAAAEKLGYHCEQEVLWQEFDEDWNPVEEGVYRLEAEEVSNQIPGLVSARVCVKKEDQTGQEAEVLFSLEVAWQQEVSGRAN